jgi:hypothetical protein
MSARRNYLALNVARNHGDEFSDQRSKTLFTAQCHDGNLYLVFCKRSRLRNGFKRGSVETQRS